MTIIQINQNKGLIMKTLSLSEAKMKLSALIDFIRVTAEEVVITKNGRPAAALVSPDEFEGWKETLAVRSDSELMEEIAGLRSFRIKRFRIIYKVSSKKEIGIVALGPRKYIYEETFRIIQKHKNP